MPDEGVCDQVRMSLEAYLDGEHMDADASLVEKHLAVCAACAAEAAAMMRMKRNLAAARSLHRPSNELRQRVLQGMRPTKKPSWRRWIVPALELAIAVAFVVAMVLPQRRSGEDVWAEAADLHVSALASANPFDVVSSDRHTVKPWFQGKIPFSFDLPELNGTAFALLGGRMVYLHQQPAAQLIFAAGRHRISVLIERRWSGDKGVTAPSVERRNSFTTASWRSNELEFYVVSDADPTAVTRLAELVAQANR